MAFGKKSTDSAEAIDVDSMVAAGDLPDDPKVINAIKSGRVDAKAFSADWKQEQASLAQTPSPAPSALDTSIVNSKITPQKVDLNLPVPVDQAPDKIVQGMVAAGDLPDDPKVLEAIKSGRVNAKAFSEDWKKEQQDTVITSATTGEVNNVDDLSVAAKSDKTFGDKFVEAFQRNNERTAYVAKKTGAGLTMGIWEPTQNAPDRATAVVGAVAEFVGGAVTGMVASSAIATLAPVAALTKSVTGASETINAIKTLGQKVPFGMKAAKYGLEASKIAADAAPIGAVVGATKSLLKGNDVTEAVVDGIVSAAEFTAFGLALQPVTGALGSLAQRASANKLAKATSVLRGSTEINDLVNKSGPKKLDDAISALKSIKDPAEKDLSALMSLEKIKTLQAKFGTDMPTALLANPDAVYGLSKAQMKNVAESMFVGESAPFRSIYDSNKGLKELVDSGQYAHALDSFNSLFASEIKNNPDASAYFNGPMGNNAKSLYNVMADRVSSRTNPEKLGAYTPEVFTNFALNPNKENELLLRQSIPDKRTFYKAKKLALSDIGDIRIKPEEVGPLVDKITTEHLKNIAGDSISFADIGKMRDTDAIARTAVTLNSGLHRTIIQAVKRNAGVNFMYADKDIQEFIPKSIKLRSLIEQNSESISAQNNVRQNIQQIQQKLRTASGSLKESLTSELATQKDFLTQLTGKIGAENRSILELNNKLEALGPELRSKVDSFASKVHLPTKSQRASIIENLGEDGSLRSVQKTLTGENSSAEFASKYGADKSPVYLKADSDLADAINAMAIVGESVDIKVPKVMTVDFLNGYQRSLRRQMGPGNPIETGLFNKFRQAEATVKDEYSSIMKRLDAIGIKEHSVEDKILMRVGEGKLLKSDPEWIALPQNVKDKVDSALTQVKPLLSDTIDRINLKLREMNWPEVNKRDDYMPHMFESVDKTVEMLNVFLGGAEKQAAYEKIPLENRPFNIRQVFDQGKTTFKNEWKRTGSEDYGQSAMQAIRKYMKPALERVHYTDLLREVDVARNFSTISADGSSGLGKFLDSFKNQVLLKKPDPIDAATMNRGGQKVLSWVNKQRSLSMVVGSANFAYQNIAANVIDAAVNGVDSLTAVTKLWGKEGDDIWRRSTNRANREVMEYDNGPASSWFKKNVLDKAVGEKYSGKITDGKEYIANFMKSATQIWDSIAAKKTYIAAYQHQLKSGLDPSSAHRMADEVVNMIHSSGSSLDRPTLFNSNAGRFFGKFQSYSMNLAATLLQDIPQMAARGSTADSVVTLLKGYAAMTLTNHAASAMNLPEPFSTDMITPFLGGYRYGTGVDLGKISESIQQGKGFKKAALKATGNAALQLAGPGALQAKKTIGAVIDTAKGDIDGSQVPVALAFGSSSAKKAQAVAESNKDESDLKLEIKNKLGKKLMGNKYKRNSKLFGR